mmetsp:Transcript_7123/g.14342  ORF Transcript_7123/g.14342 Transcript_7123/m.14342 type:complete len:274 (-) Transcript_7123:27-848(-)
MTPPCGHGSDETGGGGWIAGVFSMGRCGEVVRGRLGEALIPCIMSRRRRRRRSEYHLVVGVGDVVGISSGWLRRLRRGWHLRLHLIFIAGLVGAFSIVKLMMIFEKFASDIAPGRGFGIGHGRTRRRRRCRRGIAAAASGTRHEIHDIDITLGQNVGPIQRRGGRLRDGIGGGGGGVRCCRCEFRSHDVGGHVGGGLNHVFGGLFDRFGDGTMLLLLLLLWRWRNGSTRILAVMIAVVVIVIAILKILVRNQVVVVVVDGGGGVGRVWRSAAA